MRTRGRRASLLLGLFACLSVVAVLGTVPVYARGGGGSGGGGSSPYSCTVAVSYTTGTFYVKTTVTATSGTYLPGPSESDYVQSYYSGTLFNTQTVKYTVSSNQSTQTVTVPVSSSSTGSYSFQSTILNNKGSQLTSCSGTYTL